VGSLHDFVAVGESQHRVEGLADPRGIAHDRVEPGLEVRWRSRDHPQYFGRRPLLLERLARLGLGFRERSVLIPQLPEQPDVLDGDDRLVGEGLKERNLGFRERPRLSARHEDRPDGAALAEHGHREQAPEAAGQRDDGLHQLAVGQRVLDLDDGTCQDRARGGQPAVRAWSHWKQVAECLERLRRVVVMGGEVQQLPVEAEHGAEQPVAQAHGAPHNGVKDWLCVGPRAGDEVQNLGGRRLLLQRRRQALLELTMPGGFACPRPAGARLAGLALRLGGLRPPCHPHLLASHRCEDGAAIDDRLGRRLPSGKREGRGPPGWRLMPLAVATHCRES
jgi:hypothetical protein